METLDILEMLYKLSLVWIEYSIAKLYMFVFRFNSNNHAWLGRLWLGCQEIFIELRSIRCCCINKVSIFLVSHYKKLFRNINLEINWRKYITLFLVFILGDIEWYHKLLPIICFFLFDWPLEYPLQMLLNYSFKFEAWLRFYILVKQRYRRKRYTTIVLIVLTVLRLHNQLFIQFFF